MRYTSPGHLAQELRQRSYTLPSGAALLVVEGKTDVNVFRRLVSRSSQVVPAGGREMLLAAYDILKGTLEECTIFVFDCDANVEECRKGQLDLVITQMRDVECDILFCLNAFDSILYEFTEAHSLADEEILIQNEDLLRSSLIAAKLLGDVRQIARSKELPVRIVDRRSGHTRPLRIADLDLCDLNLESPEAIKKLVLAAEGAMSWSVGTGAEVLAELADQRKRTCKSHAQAMCLDCAMHAHCNGHDLISALCVILRGKHGVDVDERSLERQMRSGIDRTLLERWHVYARMRAWQELTGRTLIPPRPKRDFSWADIAQSM